LPSAEKSAKPITSTAAVATTGDSHAASRDGSGRASKRMDLVDKSRDA
jgi:hypothetical protein